MPTKFKLRIKTQKQLDAEIQARNRKWQKSSPDERRVMVAKDALSRIASKQFRAEEGTYEKVPSNIQGDTSAQCAIMSGVPCTCCAKGALFLSFIGIKNEVTIEEIRYNEVSSEGIDLDEGDIPINDGGITQVFSVDQLNSIENAFEGFAACSRRMTDVERKFMWLFDDPKARLIAILNNIIDNKGVFNPATTIKKYKKLVAAQ